MKPAICLVAFVTIMGCGRPASKPVTVDLQPGSSKAEAPKTVTLKAADGTTVFCDFYKAQAQPPKGVVLMFHQAGSNAGEYATIAPRIVDLGYDCLALDQRSGGNMGGRENRTVSALGGSKEYMEAAQDLTAALNWTKTNKAYKRVIAWGSSYSSSLAFKLFTDSRKTGPKLDALLVFSPGEYFDDKNQVKGWASTVTVPVFFSCTPDELKDGRQQLYNSIPANPKSELASFPGGVHGSSTLIVDKAPDGAPIYWEHLIAFFKRLD